ncbi:type I-E CRISPR-associated protein Cas6/Cse3/CasE [Nonomuraea sp. NEAU-A123]|uniref:type I-E CRISPR-associated protein Cas6/Cse3/CasE n=1 Tax=Nonomuraea sp. NEAU-A123 TaxID=2839649 RepID=UPI001BE498F0|nr:type I-E CRISPR-associated protein Cas6/Cse3/CasE [Nonomuraea sp. NEAU-A123]MBT2234434.1 type I-E CRISPR-associated protein Cas6/Cse3/CasE [Nonomuraea sp. NEAU-A123]
MTYLSRIRINPLRDKSRLFLSSPHAMHGAVMHGIPDAPTDQRILWRLDADNPHRPMLFVLTVTRPDWSHLIEQAGWPDADGEHAAIRDYAPLLAQIAVGREFAFRLTANPVQNTTNPIKPTPTQLERATEAKRRSFRLGHRTADAQLTWFLSRTGRWGFDVPPAHTDPPAPGLQPTDDEPTPTPREVRITARERRSFRKKNGGRQPIILHTATFEGRLRVTDPAAFTERLLAGIGPAKSYGCGLLTLAPLTGRPAQQDP